MQLIRKTKLKKIYIVILSRIICIIETYKHNSLLSQSLEPSIDQMCQYFGQILKQDSRCTLGYLKCKLEPIKLV